MASHQRESVETGEFHAEPAAPAGTRAWAGLALLALPTLMLGLDLTLLHLTLPAIALDLQPTSAEALWIVDSYGFFIAGFLITMGKLGDRIGRRKLLMMGGTGFAMASILAAFSTHPLMLIGARAALGVAGATLMPSTLALISNLFVEPRQRALGIGIWTTVWGIGYALGPMVGGLLVERFWWGAPFLIAVPIAVLLLVFAPRWLPEFRAPKRETLDFTSVILSLAAVLPFIYGVKQLPTSGWASLDSVGVVAIGFFFGALFVRRQKRMDDPLLDLRLFTHRAFSVALVVLLVGLMAVGGAMLLVAQFLQLVAGHSPVDAGLMMGLSALAMIAGGLGAPLLARAIRPGFVFSGSLGLVVGGYLLLTQLEDSPLGVAIALTALALAYLGNGTLAALGTELVIGSVSPEKAGSASATSEMAQDLGISLGIALLGSLAGGMYRLSLGKQVPEDLAPETREALFDSLWSAVASELPAELLEQARSAFLVGIQATGTLGAVGLAVVVLLSAIALRNIGVRRIDEDGERV